LRGSAVPLVLLRMTHVIVREYRES
jgi:hypothetical protein